MLHVTLPNSGTFSFPRDKNNDVLVKVECTFSVCMDQRVVPFNLVPHILVNSLADVLKQSKSAGPLLGLTGVDVSLTNEKLSD